MIITLEDKLFLSDFTFDKQEEIISYIRDRLENDADFIEQLKEEAKEELITEETEVTEKRIIEIAKDKLQEKAEDLAGSIRIYCEYDVKY